MTDWIGVDMNDDSEHRPRWRLSRGGAEVRVAEWAPDPKLMDIRIAFRTDAELTWRESDPTTQRKRTRTVPTDGPVCSFPDCATAAYTKGHCKRHYGQLRKSGLLPHELYAKHFGKCAVATCGNEGDLVLDHDHACCEGKSGTRCGKCERAFICSRCNRALYWIEEGLGQIVVVPGTSPLVEGLLDYVSYWKQQHGA